MVSTSWKNCQRKWKVRSSKTRYLQDLKWCSLCYSTSWTRQNWTIYPWVFFRSFTGRGNPFCISLQATSKTKKCDKSPKETNYQADTGKWIFESCRNRLNRFQELTLRLYSESLMGSACSWSLLEIFLALPIILQREWTSYPSPASAILFVWFSKHSSFRQWGWIQK